MEISKKLLFPKSPFDEILENFPFSILPIKLNLTIFSDKGAITFSKLISISLFIFEKYFLLSRLKILGKFEASNLLPEILFFCQIIL